MMKNLRLLSILMLALCINACSDSDDGNDGDDGIVSGTPGISATIDGGTFDDYTFTSSVINPDFTNNTLEILAGDTNGQQLTVFMNSTNGFSADAEKEIGNVNGNFMTFVVIRQVNPELTYNSTSGSITITRNIANPENSNERLISGRFNSITSTNGDNTTTLTGTFVDIAYND